jgi:hypothetical protein
MSFQGQMIIRDPEVRWPVMLVAAIVTTLLVLVTAGVLHLTLTKPAAQPAAQPRLEGALRPETPGFEPFREKIIVEQLRATEAPRPPGDSSLVMNATVRNATDRTLSGLEMRGGIVDAQMSILRERTIVVIPARQTALEPGEAINVHILLEGIRPEWRRAGMMMEVTAVRLD